MATAVDAAISPELLNAIGENADKLAALEEEHMKKLDAIAIPHQRARFKLLAARQPELDKLEGLWTAAIAAPDSPLKELLIQIDTKLCRAITQLRMELEEPKPDYLVTKLIITFRDNMFVHGGEVSLSMDRSKQVVSASGIKWKVPEKMREGSIFGAFAGVQPGIDAEFIYEVFTGFEVLYGDPLVFANGDE